MKKKNNNARCFSIKIKPASATIDIDQLIGNALDIASIDNEMLRLEFTCSRSKEFQFGFYFTDLTTQGTMLELSKKGVLTVIIPPFASDPDVDFALSLVKAVEKMDPMAEISWEDNISGQRNISPEEAKNDIRNNYVEALSSPQSHFVMEGALGSYHLCAPFVNIKYGELDINQKVDRVIDDFRTIVWKLKDDTIFGKAAITAPDGESYEARFVSNRDGWGNPLDKFVLTLPEGVKIVDAKTFMTAASGNPHFRFLDPSDFMMEKMSDEEWTSFCDSLNGETIREKTNTYLLRWNPAISSFNAIHYQNAIKRHGDRWGMDWSIWEYQNAHKGDRFFMLREGDGVDPGIYYSGYFSSEPYAGDDWAGSGKKRMYVDIECEHCLPLEDGPWLTTEQLEGAIPGINWRKGHSGELLNEKQADKLEQLWNETINHHLIATSPGASAAASGSRDADEEKPDEVAEDAENGHKHTFQNDPDRFLAVIDDDVEGLLHRFLNGKLLDIYKSPEAHLISSVGNEVCINGICVANEYDGGLSLEVASPYVVNKEITARGKLLKIEEYDTGLEAVLTIDVEGHKFGFYAADYIMHKDEYCVGETYGFALSALAVRAEKVPEKDLTVVLGKDWIERSGYPAKEGEEEVTFKLDLLMTLLQRGPEYPQIGEFQSPTLSKGRKVTAFGKEFYQLTIGLRLGDSGTDLPIPMIASASFFDEKPRKGTPVRGILLLQGIMIP